MPVDVIALSFDFWFEIAQADNTLDVGEKPEPLGPVGCLYHVRFVNAGRKGVPTWVESAGHSTIDEAMVAAERRAPAPIRWSTP